MIGTTCAIDGATGGDSGTGLAIVAPADPVPGDPVPGAKGAGAATCGDNRPRDCANAAAGARQMTDATAAKSNLRH
jgi:hypothetical protein